jgi:hypothetical protein
MPTTTKKSDEKLDALSAKLQDEHGLTEAEADLAIRRSNGGKDDLDAEVQYAALGDTAPPTPSRPRLAPNARLDEVEGRIAALESELADLRRSREVVESRDVRVGRQGTVDVPDEPTVLIADTDGAVTPAAQQTQPSDVDKAANAEKKAAEKAQS